MHKLFYLFFLLMIAAVTRADVRMPVIFSNNMMLQRDKPIHIWGYANPQEAITVTLEEAKQTATADANGNWSLLLPVRATGENLTLTVAGANTITLTNLIVGDIWFCSGQSNMEFTLRGTAVNEDWEKADFPQLRMIRVDKYASGFRELELPRSPRWVVCTPQTAGNYTAVGHFFAREIMAKTKVPIGLIDDAWGGSKIEPWLSPEGLATVPELKPVGDDIDKKLAEYRQKLLAYFPLMERWSTAAKAAIVANEEIPAMPAMPENPCAPHFFQGNIYGMYFGMVYPATFMPVKGVIWYQGESNGGEGDSYLQKMQALINGWRLAWKNPEMPFYYVQLANFTEPQNQNPAGGDGWAKLRMAQLQALAIPHTGMAVTTDIGDPKDIHPKNKYDVGLRLALWALKNDYNQQDIVFSGPLYRKMTAGEGKITLEFDHVGAGLMIGKKIGRETAVADTEGKLSRFAIAGEDKKWFWAEAEIVGDTVVVSSKEVANPAAVRYAFTSNTTGANLYNKNGLPASPFRTDNW